MQRSVVSSAILVVSALFGCSETPSTPVCRTASDVSIEPKAHAHCLLLQNKHSVFLVNQYKKLVTLEVEGAGACELHSKVWRETGFNINVASLLYENDNQAIYQCDIEGNSIPLDEPLTLPSWRESTEFKRIQHADLFLIDRLALADPNQLVPLREAFVTAINNINE